MIHNKYSMSISRMGLLLETGNKRLIARYWFTPWFMVNRGHRKLMEYFEETFVKQSDEFKNEVIRIKMWNKLKTMLPTLHILLATDDNAYAKELFKELYGKEYSSMDDLDYIKGEIEKLSARYKAMFRKKPKDVPAESVTFENIVQGVEMVLEKSHIPREVKLYQFEDYYKLSLKRIRELQTKRHGKG